MPKGPNGNDRDFYAGMGAQEYRDKISTPARNPEYFSRFHKPMIERTKQRFGVPITVLDVACGPADELQFFVNDRDVRFIATDSSSKVIQETRRSLPSDARVFADDVRDSKLEKEVAHAGILLNAMVYSPDKMLETMHRALKPGGECAVNFFTYDNPYRQEFYAHWISHKAVLRDKEFSVDTEHGPEVFKMKVLDYMECIDHNGKPDNEIRGLGEQMYFGSVGEVKRFISLSGLSIVGHEPFDYASPVSSHIQTEVFILQKSV